jgi:hypothetical protein
MFYRDYIDLSVATATLKALVTPVPRNAEGIAELGRKVRDDKLTIDRMPSGTLTMFVFSISPWIYMRVGLTWFVITRKVACSVARPARQSSTCVSLQCLEYTPSKASPSSSTEG